MIEWSLGGPRHIGVLGHWELVHCDLIRISDFGFRIFCISLLLLTLLLPTPILALTPATLLGSDLQPRAVNIESLSEGVLSYFDTDRQFKTQALDQLLQIRDLGGPRAGGWSAATAESGPYVELVDGQRLEGQWVGATPDGQNVLWHNGVLGTVTISLDNLKAWSCASIPLFLPQPAPARPTRIWRHWSMATRLWDSSPAWGPTAWN